LLEGFLGLESGFVISKIRLAAKIRRLSEAAIPEVSAGHALTYTLALALNLSKKALGEKKTVRVVEKCQPVTIHYVDMVAFRKAVLTNLSIPVFVGTLGCPVSNLGQRRYLPSFRTKGFTYQATLSGISRLGAWRGRQRMDLQIIVNFPFATCFFFPTIPSFAYVATFDLFRYAIKRCLSYEC
jgi:hypothetical protein